MTTIDSIAELREAEAEILERVVAVPNGALLFLIDPLRAITDAGFELSDSTVAELRRVVGGSEVPLAAYTAIKESGEARVETVELGGLFDWSELE